MKAPRRSQPAVTIVAGPNGSGKTTLTRHLAAQGVNLGTYINADDIAAGFSELPLTQRSQKAQVVADRQRHACLEQGVDFTFETVMSHPSKVEFIKVARLAGYFVQLICVGIEDPAVNIVRVRQRVALGGHDVPEDRIVAHWHRTMAELPTAIIASDRALLFDDSATIGTAADRLGPRPAAEWIDGVLTLMLPEQPQPTWLLRARDEVWRRTLSSPA